MASSPRIVSTTFNRRRQSWSFAEMPLSLYIVPPRAQASRRCETQAPLSGKPPSCAKRFGPLTPSARSGNLIAGDGTKNGPSRSEQRTANNQKQPLDRKSRIQVRIRLPSALSHVRTRLPEHVNPRDRFRTCANERIRLTDDA